MRQPDDLKRELVSQWLTKADKDLAAARILLQSGQSVLGIVGFHAQQAAEKSMKAYLVQKQIDFPKTHSIGALLMLISRDNPPLAHSLNSAIGLSQYAVEMRYPGDIPELGRDEAEAALRIAESACGAISLALEGGR